MNLFRAMFAIQNYLVSELLEVNVVTLAAAVEPEKQDDRAMHHTRKEDRASRENSWRAQELTFCCLVAA